MNIDRYLIKHAYISKRDLDAAKMKEGLWLGEADIFT
jgi:hypothetical protein